MAEVLCNVLVRMIPAAARVTAQVMTRAQLVAHVGVGMETEHSRVSMKTSRPSGGGLSSGQAQSSSARVRCFDAYADACHACCHSVSCKEGSHLFTQAQYSNRHFSVVALFLW